MPYPGLVVTRDSFFISAQACIRPIHGDVSNKLATAEGHVK